jgi:hypothetical protein
MDGAYFRLSTGMTRGKRSLAEDIGKIDHDQRRNGVGE